MTYSTENDKKMKEKTLYHFYKLESTDPDVKEIYVGSTTNFRNRKCSHKSRCHNESSKEYNKHVYQYIRDNGGFLNWQMIEVHRQECDDVIEARRIENEWVKRLGATLNKVVPGRTKAEYYQENHDSYLEYHKKYRKENKAKIKEHSSQKYECDCGGRYTNSNKAYHEKTARHKKYIDNLNNQVDEMLDNITDDTLINDDDSLISIPDIPTPPSTPDLVEWTMNSLPRQTDDIQDDKLETIEINGSKRLKCPCGGSYRYNKWLQHKRTARHVDYINSL